MNESEIVCTATNKIKPDAGDYLIIVDYYIEGLSVWSQHKTAIEVLRAWPYAPQPAAIVKLVRMSAKEIEEEKAQMTP